MNLKYQTIDLYIRYVFSSIYLHNLYIKFVNSNIFDIVMRMVVTAASTDALLWRSAKIWIWLVILLGILN